MGKNLKRIVSKKNFGKLLGVCLVLIGLISVSFKLPSTPTLVDYLFIVTGLILLGYKIPRELINFKI